jgi:hypothetical protein
MYIYVMNSFMESKDMHMAHIGKLAEQTEHMHTS